MGGIVFVQPSQQKGKQVRMEVISVPESMREGFWTISIREGGIQKNERLTGKVKENRTKGKEVVTFKSDEIEGLGAFEKKSKAHKDEDVEAWYFATHVWEDEAMRKKRLRKNKMYRQTRILKTLKKKKIEAKKSGINGTEEGLSQMQMERLKRLKKKYVRDKRYRSIIRYSRIE